MDTVNKEWNIKVVFITFYKFSVTAMQAGISVIWSQVLSPTDNPMT